MRTCLSITLILAGGLLSSCSDDPAVTPMADAPSVISNVETVACTTGEAGPIVAMDGMFVPNTAAIAVGGVVKFQTTATHNVVPDGTTEDAGLVVGFGTTACLKFKAAGTYKFKCNPHSFKGTITVN